MKKLSKRKSKAKRGSIIDKTIKRKKVSKRKRNPETISKSNINEMREWLKEIYWKDISSEEIDELSNSEIINAVKRHYAGGIKQFLEDGK